MSRNILVFGATGKQGGSVVQSLVKQNADFKILGVTRNTRTKSAKKLLAESSSITLVQGDLDDAEDVFLEAEKLAGKIWGVYSVQVASMNKKGPVIEEAQGKAVVDAAVKHGVKHIVYSSVDRHGEDSSNNPTNVPHFTSKHNIEKYLIAQAPPQMSWTILRPVAFMENLDPGFVGKMFATAWREKLKDKPLQLVATEDIGVFAALSFMNSEEYNGKSLSLAGDELTWDQLTKVYVELTGSPPPTTYGFVARALVWSSHEMSTMFEFFAKEGYAADIELVRQLNPVMKDFETWMKTVELKK